MPIEDDVPSFAPAKSNSDSFSPLERAEEAKAACEGGGRGGGGDVTFRAPCLACRAQEAPRP